MSGEVSERPARSQWFRHPLFALALGLVALRLTAMLTSMERVSYWEELYRGTIAKELIEGLKVPLWEYQADHYAAGSLVVGALAAPLYALFGPRLIVLKMVPLAVSLIALALLWRWLDREFGRRAALIGGALYVLAPPTFTQLSLLAMGFHADAVVFSYGMLLLLYRVLDDTRDPTVPLSVLGLLIGGAWSFTHITALTAAVCVVGLLVKRRGVVPTRAGAGCLLGLAAGLVPWIAYNVTHGFRGVDVLGTAFASPGANADARLYTAARNLVMLVIVGVPRSLGFVGTLGIPGVALSYAYTGLIVATLATLWWTTRGQDASGTPRRVTLLPLLAYPVMFLGVYALSTHGGSVEVGGGLFEFRLFGPLQGLAIPLVAIVLSRTGARGLVIGLLVLGGLGQASLLFNHPPRQVLAYRGYAYHMLGQVWAWRLYRSSVTFAEAAPLLATLSERDRRYAFWGLTEAVSGEKWWPGDPRTLSSMLGQVPAAYRGFFVEAAAGRLADLGDDDPERLRDLLEYAPDAHREQFYLGFALPAASVLRDRPVADYQRVFRDVDARYHHLFYLALGESLGECVTIRRDPMCARRLATGLALESIPGAWVHRGLGRYQALAWQDATDISGTLELGRRVPDARRGDLLWGIGWGLRGWFGEDRRRALDAIDDLPVDWREPARGGVQAFEAWYGLGSR